MPSRRADKGSEAITGHRTAYSCRESSVTLLSVVFDPLRLVPRERPIGEGH